MKRKERVLNNLFVFIFIFSGYSVFAQKKESLEINKVQYNVISKSKTNRLKAIRDSYGSITGLEKRYKDSIHSNGLPYHIYVSGNLKKGKKYPLVTFLHGYTDLTIDTHKGFPKGVWSLPIIQYDFPHILFVPRYRSNDDMWIQDNYRAMAIEALNDLIIEFNSNSNTPNIDENRLYLTGFSQGGMGTWSFIKHYPNKFAAAAPLSGFFKGPQNKKEAEALKHIPIWIFNGDSDRGINGSRISYKALKAVESNVTYHEYENQGHVIDDFAYFTTGFLDWMFSQELETEIKK